MRMRIQQAVQFPINKFVPQLPEPLVRFLPIIANGLDGGIPIVDFLL